MQNIIARTIGSPSFQGQFILLYYNVFRHLQPKWSPTHFSQKGDLNRYGLKCRPYRGKNLSPDHSDSPNDGQEYFFAFFNITVLHPTL